MDNTITCDSSLVVEVAYCTEGRSLGVKLGGFRFIKWLRNVSFNMLIGMVLVARPTLLECQRVFPISLKLVNTLKLFQF
jgi:hypothetical protein